MAIPHLVSGRYPRGTYNWLAASSSTATFTAPEKHINMLNTGFLRGFFLATVCFSDALAIFIPKAEVPPLESTGFELADLVDPEVTLVGSGNFTQCR
jgi:hypothetical protein